MSKSMEININFIVLLKKHLKNGQKSNSELIKFYEENFLNNYLEVLKKSEIKNKFGNDDTKELVLPKKALSSFDKKYEDIHQQAILLFLEELNSQMEKDILVEFNTLCALICSDIVNYIEKYYPATNNTICSLEEENPIEKETPESKYEVTDSFLYALSTLTPTEVTIFR